LSETEADRTAATSTAAKISNGVVHVLSEYTGRGPTRARTHISDEVVTVVLRDTLTKGERSLVPARNVSLSWQHATAFRKRWNPS